MFCILEYKFYRATVKNKTLTIAKLFQFNSAAVKQIIKPNGIFVKYRIWQVYSEEAKSWHLTALVNWDYLQILNILYTPL